MYFGFANKEGLSSAWEGGGPCVLGALGKSYVTMTLHLFMVILGLADTGKERGRQLILAAFCI